MMNTTKSPSTRAVQRPCLTSAIRTSCSRSGAQATWRSPGTELGRIAAPARRQSKTAAARVAQLCRYRERMHVVERGSGTPLVLLHGFGVDHRLLLPLDPTIEASGTWRCRGRTPPCWRVSARWPMRTPSWPSCTRPTMRRHSSSTSIRA